MKNGKKMLPVLYLAVISTVLGIAVIGDRAVTAATEAAPLPRRSCIIIDAGHGGVDGGATSCTGVLESAFNLEIALRLQDVLHLLGYETKMIRTEDISVYTQGTSIAQKKVSDLRERVRIVNETENALLLSIHQNNFPDGRYSGAQVFYCSAGSSEQLAKKMQQALATVLTPGNRRGVKKATGVYLMEHIQKTGILIECGFLSNPEEEAKLRSPEYQKKLCCVIAGTVSVFLQDGAF